MRNKLKQTKEVKDRRLIIRKYSRLLLVVGVIVIAFLLSSYCFLRYQAEKDITKALFEGENIKYREQVSINYEEIRVSLRHGVYVSFDVVGDKYITWARWTLYPYREVMFSK